MPNIDSEMVVAAKMAAPADNSMLHWPLVVGMLTLLGLLAGCSNDVVAMDQTKTVQQAVSLRVIITLAPAPNSAVTEPGMEAAVEYLQTAYPNARVLRTMPGFSQLSIELPQGDIDALRADPLVRSAQPDASHQASQSQQ